MARDYIYDKPVLLGYMRFGPDLANIGTRKDPDDPDKYSTAWHYMHLYKPQITSPGSNMPSYKFLFEKRKIAGRGGRGCAEADRGAGAAAGIPDRAEQRGAATGGVSDDAGPQPSAAGGRSEHPTAQDRAQPGGSAK